MSASLDAAAQATAQGAAQAPAEAAAPHRRTAWLARLAPSTFVAILFLAAVLVLVAVVPFTPGYDPFAQDIASSMAPPLSAGTDRFFLLGADFLGRDLLSRLALAGQLSLLISVSAVGISLVLGVFLGLVAGFFRGPVENLVMGVADLQLAIPRILLLIAVTAVVGPSIATLTVLLGVTSWVSYGRVARAMALSLREREFVLAATTQGAGPAWNIRKHLLPNVLPEMVILASFELGQMVSLEASLSYFGLGVQPPLPSWGLMISEGQSYLAIDPWLSVLPGCAIFLLIAGVQFVTREVTAEDELDLSSRAAA